MQLIKNNLMDESRQCLIATVLGRGEKTGCSSSELSGYMLTIVERIITGYMGL